MSKQSGSNSQGRPSKAIEIVKNVFFVIGLIVIAYGLFGSAG